jgi:cellulose synthase/poly-beta-1,6-N-acetylglucosamine synthase-like glycosyltransferase
LAFEPSGKAASDIHAGDEREVLGTSPPSPAPVHAGFREQSALFRAVPDLPVELRALQGLVDPVFLRYAAAQAEMLGISADLIVARSNTIDSEAVLEAYAADLGVEIDWLDNSAADETIDAAEILSSGVLPEDEKQNRHYPTIALTGSKISDAYERITERSKRKFKITSAERLRAYVTRSAATTLAEEAAFALRDKRPNFSAAATRFAHYRIVLLATLLAAAVSFYLAPGPARFLLEVLLAAIFLAWAGLRLFACFSPPHPEEILRKDDRDLPFYTILVPLYGEARVVPDLVAAISALNYPREKLDVKLILESDDAATIAAVQAIKLDPSFEIIYAPALGPRTKPKALRAAIPFVRGEFVVVYDAEDRPHPDQLRAAYVRFLSGDTKLACVQAKLSVDNKKLGFLTGHFRAEYSGLFDVLLPVLARLRLPLPLGGTSNHFRTSVLRDVGAWDPHNVTEDADLGVRLARFGFTTDVVDSTTWEEAPARLGAWLPQRTRWMKGWLQTYMVHMRNPFLLFRQLGWRGFLAFQLLIGGSVLAALVHPIFAVLLLTDAALGSLLLPAETAAQWAQKALVFITLMSGYIASGLLAFVGMRRRGFLSSAWVLLTIPIYWILLSAAAWRAVWKQITAPHQWEKTTHGVAPRDRALR